MAKRKRINGQKSTYKTLDRKLEQHEPHKKPRVNSDLCFLSSRLELTAIFLPWDAKDRATRTPQKTKNDLQNTTQKIKDRATQTPLKTNNDLPTLYRTLKIEQHEHH